MPRPNKIKSIQAKVKYDKFLTFKNNNEEYVILSVEEFETIKLIDYENLKQEDCALKMNVARTTVQKLYSDARKKIASYLVNGTKLKITGGCYCIKKCNNKGEKKDMILAIPMDNNDVNEEMSISFGRASYFLIYNLDNDKFNFIENEGINIPGGAGIKAAQLLIDNKVDVLITASLGTNAFEILDEAKVKTYENSDKFPLNNIRLLKENSLKGLSFIHRGKHNI